MADDDVRGVFKGVLKRLDVDDLEPKDQALFDELFPGFRQTDERIRSWFDDNPVQVITGRNDSTWEGHGRYGRFAGLSLGPGRYYTVCRDKSGADGGTLLRELLTYWYFADDLWKDNRLLVPELTDTTADPDSISPQLVIDVQRYVRKRALLGAKVKPAGRIRLAFPLSVDKVKIKNVVDLRLPDTQRWFLKRFRKLEEKASERGVKLDTGLTVKHPKFDVRRPKTFVDLLPTLVEPGPGGTMFSQAVGVWLRSNGVAGLVYPSARCDVTFVPDRKASRSEGWNFVDYRGASATESEDLFGRLPRFIRSNEIGITIASDGGSGWAIEGAESGEFGRFEIKRQQMLGQIPVNVPDPRYNRFK